MVERKIFGGHAELHTTTAMWIIIILKWRNTKSLKCVTAQPHNCTNLGNWKTMCSILQAADNSTWPEVVIECPCLNPLVSSALKQFFCFEMQFEC